MSSWRTLVAAAVAAGLAAYIYWVEQPRIASEQASGRVLVFSPSEVDRVELKYPDARRLLVERRDRVWMLLHPMETEADAGTVSLLLKAIHDTEVERIIPGDEAEQLSTYGLEGDGQRARISLRLEDGTQLPDIVVGRTTPVGYQAFARVIGREEVLVTPLLFHSGVGKTDFDFRSKTVFRVDATTVVGATLQSGDTTYRLDRKDGRWRIGPPIDALADGAVVQSLVAGLNEVTPVAFYEGDDIDRSGFGLDPPAVRFEIETSDGRHEGIAIGKGSQEGNPGYYAERLSDGQLLKGPEWLRARYAINLATLRDKHLFSCPKEQVGTISVKNGGNVVLSLSLDANGNWTSSAKPDQPLDQRRADRAATAILDLTGESPSQDRPLSAYGLDTPDVEVAIATREGQPCGGAVATRAAGEDGYYVASSGSDVVMLLPEHLYSRLDVRVEDLLSR